MGEAKAREIRDERLARERKEKVQERTYILAALAALDDYEAKRREDDNQWSEK